MNDLWATPQYLFDKLHREFQFTLDVCALPENAKCANFFTPEQDGLLQRWEGRVWMNPPYGRGIEKWLEKASHQADYTHCECVVALIPNRSNAPWWHEYVMKAAEIRFVRKKVPFTGRVKGVPFWGSVIVVFDGLGGRYPKVSSYDQR